jgi:single-stranded DNA-binding protein
MNKSILIGNVGNDPVLANTTGTPVCNVSFATHESWTDQTTKQRQEKTEWHRLVLFGQSATNFVQYVKKGRLLSIEGRLQTRRYEGKAFTFNADPKLQQPVMYGDNTQAQVAAKSTEIVVTHWEFEGANPDKSAYAGGGQAFVMTTGPQAAVVVGNSNMPAGTQANLFSTPPDGV